MSDSAHRPRGRPRDPAKRLALLTAARDLFLQRGADAVTVDQVIAGANVSRATYYSNFADRHELLAAVISQESERIVPMAERRPTDDVNSRDALAEYGDGFIAFLAHPDTPRLEPLIAHVGLTQPELGAALFAAGPRRVWDVLGTIISAGQERGEIDPDLDLEQAISDLIGLWRGSWSVKMSYGQRAIPDEAEQRRLSRHGVDVFLRAFGRSPATALKGAN